MGAPTVIKESPPALMEKPKEAIPPPVTEVPRTLPPPTNVVPPPTSNFPPPITSPKPMEEPPRMPPTAYPPVNYPPPSGTLSNHFTVTHYSSCLRLPCCYCTSHGKYATLLRSQTCGSTLSSTNGRRIYARYSHYHYNDHYRYFSRIFHHLLSLVGRSGTGSTTTTTGPQVISQPLHSASSSNVKLAIKKDKDKKKDKKKKKGIEISRNFLKIY